MKHYDFLIIGTGAGNIVLDQALEQGLSCAQIEKGDFGGTCLNRGCIPSKILITPADLMREVARLRNLGILKGELEVDWSNLKDRLFAKTKENQDILAEYKAEANLDVYQGTGYFVEDKVLQVKQKDGSTSEKITADIIVLAGGSRTNIPPIKGLDKVTYLTSETFFQKSFPKKPYQSLTIIGGGVIATEFAHLFANYGTKVNIVQRNVRLVPKLDHELSATLLKHFEDRGINCFLNQNSLQVEQDNLGIHLTIEDKSTKNKQTLTSEALLIAPGVVSNADLLQLDKTTIKTDERNYVLTNEYLETSVPNVYALGDLVGQQQLRHKANYEAEVLAFNLFSPEAKERRRQVRYDFMPSGVFSDPQLACVGMTEEELQSKNIAYKVGRFDFADSAKGYALGIDHSENLFTKVLLSEDDQLLGVHIAGPNATDLIQPYINLLYIAQSTSPIYNSEIATRRTVQERKLAPRQLRAHYAEALSDAVVIHPSLSETSIWAASTIEE